MSEIKVILRAADPLIAKGGRTLLAKVLKGSRDKDIRQQKLYECPGYGYFEHASLAEITAKIDWLILNDYMAIGYDYRLPLLFSALCTVIRSVGKVDYKKVRARIHLDDRMAR